MTRWQPGIVVLAAALLQAPVSAQVGGSIGFDSDYRFRGVSLSGERPDLRASLSFDGDSGGYAGLAAIGARTEDEQRLVTVQGYAGFGGAAGESLRWEAGASFARTAQQARHYDYGEVFAGLLSERASLRLYVSPDYFSSGQRTLYAELDAVQPLSPDWRLAGHLGLLRQLGGAGAHRFDVRLALVRQLAVGLDLQLAWIGSGQEGPQPRPYDQRRRTWVLGASYAF